VPAVIVGLILVAWLVLAGLPFGGDRDRKVAAAPKTETIAEGTTTREPGTVIDVPDEQTTTADEAPNTITEVAPPVTTNTTPATTTIAPMTPPVTATARPQPVPAQPVPVHRPPVVPVQRPPVTTPPPATTPATTTPRRDITEAEAAAQLRGYVTSRNYYGVATECVKLNPRGYRNEGYAFEVWHACAGGGSSRLLGRWRVDEHTREVFVQRDDGRYLRP
jgi:hypothetical protein